MDRMTDAVEVGLGNSLVFEREKVKVCVDFRLADCLRRDFVARMRNLARPCHGRIAKAAWTVLGPRPRSRRMDLVSEITRHHVHKIRHYPSCDGPAIFSFLIINFVPSRGTGLAFFG